MTYKYLYQDKSNRNCEGEIKARSRDEAYTILRKQGIKPYRVIGDDPWNWRPWAVASGYLILLFVIGLLALKLVDGNKRLELSDEEAAAFRARAIEAVNDAPEAYRFNVWKGVNARLEERGLEPLPCPEGLVEDTFHRR